MDTTITPKCYTTYYFCCALILQYTMVPHYLLQLLEVGHMVFMPPKVFAYVFMYFKIGKKNVAYKR